jgi:hypothetical protein
MKIQTLLITTFVFTLSFAIAQENGATPLVQVIEKSGVDPFKTSTSTSEPSSRAPELSFSSDSPDREGVIPPPPSTGVAENPVQGPFSLQRAFPVEDPQPPTLEPLLEAKSTSQGREALTFCYEDFSFSVEMLADIKSEKLQGAAALYEYLNKRLETDSGKDLVRQEIHVELQAKSGFPTTSENYVSTDSNFKNPNRLGYRITLEFDATKDISLRFDLDNAVEAGSVKILDEGKQVEKPLIHTQRVNTTVTLSLDKACLVSAELRTVGSKQGTNAGKRVYVGFITASAGR